MDITSTDLTAANNANNTDTEVGKLFQYLTSDGRKTNTPYYWVKSVDGMQ